MSDKTVEAKTTIPSVSQEHIDAIAKQAGSYTVAAVDRVRARTEQEISELVNRDVNLRASEVITRCFKDHRYTHHQKLAKSPDQMIDVNGRLLETRVFDRRCINDGDFDLGDQATYTFGYVLAPSSEDENWYEKFVPMDKVVGPIELDIADPEAV